MMSCRTKGAVVGLLVLSCLEGYGQVSSVGKEKDVEVWATSDAWAATDALGRELPMAEDVGDARTGKFVGMFYWTWHVDWHVAHDPINVELITRRFPEAIHDGQHPVWSRVGSGHHYHWDEPLFGYYRATDPWVLRKHAEMLADAKVDVVVFDATNGSFTWANAYEVLFPVFAEARMQGVQAPHVAFMLPFGPSDASLKSIEQLYGDVYEPGRFKDLWFLWKGKPLIMAYPDNVPEPMRSFFTFRPGQPVYKTGPTRPDHWGWLEIHPQHGFVESEEGQFEQVTVGVAQNATDDLWPAAMNDPKEVYGRGYTVAHGPNHSWDAIARGLNFQEQWGRALDLDPELVFVTGWNEWIAGRYETWQGTSNAFPDQFNDEYSRDIEPMRGGFQDNYYYQLVDHIRRFKGVARMPEPSPAKTISIQGRYEDWLDVGPEYRDHRGDVLKRDHKGYGERLVYRNETGRNDIVSAKVARDEENIYFMVRTVRPLTRPEGFHWMMLLLDMDRDKTTGWEGYEFAVNRIAPADKAFLEWNAGDWKWTVQGEVKMAMGEDFLELAIPRAYLGVGGNPLDFEFKWVDNLQREGDIMDFYLSGDAAPGGRFNYVFTEK